LNVENKKNIETENHKNLFLLTKKGHGCRKNETKAELTRALSLVREVEITQQPKVFVTLFYLLTSFCAGNLKGRSHYVSQVKAFHSA